MKRHLKRLAMPKTWPLARKQTVWITKPLPSGHPLKHSLPINIVLRDILKITRSTKETKKLLSNEKILVDMRRVKDYKESIGLFDRIYLPGFDKYYTLIINNKNKLQIVEISKEEAKIKPLKIKNKVMIKRAKIQLTFHDGRTIIADNKYKVNDSVIFDIKNKKIIKHLPLKEGSLVYVIGGKHTGKVGKVKSILLKGNKKYVLVEIAGEKESETLIENIFVVNEKLINEIKSGND